MAAARIFLSNFTVGPPDYARLDTNNIFNIVRLEAPNHPYCSGDAGANPSIAPCSRVITQPARRAYRHPVGQKRAQGFCIIVVHNPTRGSLYDVSDRR